MNADRSERLEFLLAMRATEPLPESEEHELTALFDQHPEITHDGFDLAAAALLVEMLPEEPLPADLRRRLVAEGERQVSAGARIVPLRPADSAAMHGSRLGWLAAAAGLLLALAGWWPRLASPPTVASPPAATAPSAGEARRELLATAPDVEILPWSATDDPAAAGAAGDVVWSPSRQRGYMRIQRLEANVPTVAQYQLWIFDRRRDERYPVDGGVFDMPAGSAEAIVPIDARVPVAEPYLFAVTVETPGGVVVSERQRIVLVAQPST